MTAVIVLVSIVLGGLAGFGLLYFVRMAHDRLTQRRLARQRLLAEVQLQLVTQAAVRQLFAAARRDLWNER